MYYNNFTLLDLSLNCLLIFVIHVPRYVINKTYDYAKNLIYKELIIIIISLFLCYLLINLIVRTVTVIHFGNSINSNHISMVNCCFVSV